MTIRLQILTEEPKEIELIERYWAVDESGEFREKVSALGAFLEMTQGASLASFVRQRCRAFDENQISPHCQALIEIKNRSQAKKTPQRASRPCSTCQEAIDALEREARQTKAAELERRLKEYADALSSLSVDYASSTDDQVLLLSALDRTINPRLTQGGFTVGDCRALAPLYVSDFVQKLRDANLLVEAPAKAIPGTYFLKDDEIWVKRAQVVYVLAPNTVAGRGDEAFRALLERTNTDAEGLFSLWQDYSVADVMCYLANQCETYNHELGVDELDEIKSTIRSALKTYSVSQLWSVCWRVVRDAASLANREYYNRPKASATIPGKIRRYLERVRRESIELKSWTRPEHQPAGALGMVLSETFDIDEETTGLIVYSRIARLTGQVHEAASLEVELSEPIRELMTFALAHDIGSSVMLQFAELIRAGHDVSFAVEELGSALRP